VGKAGVGLLVAARALLGLIGALNPAKVYDVAIVGAGPAGFATAVYATEGLSVLVVGNSAGQASVYLASRASKVWLLVRGPSLGAGMSRYLVDCITGLPNVEVMTLTEVTGLEGRDGALAVHWRRRHPERIGAPRREFVDEPSLGRQLTAAAFGAVERRRFPLSLPTKENGP
jgi:thioredoxin reductase